MNSILLFLYLTASFKWEVHQMDVKYAFLRGDLHEEIYMEQPIGSIQTNSSLVYRLKKSLYGLKKAPRAWYAKMDSFLLEIGFSRCHYDNTIYTKKVHKFLIILVLYVGDIILTGSDPKLINHMKSSLKKNFEMSDLGHLIIFLVFKSCNLRKVFPFPSPRKLLYLTHARPDLSFVVGLIAWFMQNSHEIHWKAAKRIIRYVQGPITWACKKQSAISLSSIEAEYCGVVEASKEALWLRQILSQFGCQQQHPTTLWCDNQSAIQLCRDPVQDQRSKHIELHMHFIRRLIHDHVLEVKYCSTNDQVAYIFTKALTEVKFTKLQFMVGVQEIVTVGG
eukprot:PITA_32867